MSDTDIRALERAHQAGDRNATEALIRAHERTGNQDALCQIGVHRFGDPRSVEVWGRVGPGDSRAQTTSNTHAYIMVPSVYCYACRTTEPVHWCAELQGDSLANYRRRVHIAQMLGEN